VEHIPDHPEASEEEEESDSSESWDPNKVGKSVKAYRPDDGKDKIIFGLNDRTSKLSALSQDSGAPIIARKSLWASLFHVDDGVDYAPEDQMWVRDMIGDD
jgi:hypothetical protein